MDEKIVKVDQIDKDDLFGKSELNWSKNEEEFAYEGRLNERQSEDDYTKENLMAYD